MGDSGSQDMGLTLAMGVLLFALLFAVWLIIFVFIEVSDRVSHGFSVWQRSKKQRIKDRFLESMRIYLDKFSEEQQAMLRVLLKSGRRSEQQTARFLTISEESASHLIDEFQREQ
jgi:UDP-N-acetylmuramyl pentapeptide phosphotransferase/UDP-N-acetylglucosamine-1-phosphate transferase